MNRLELMHDLALSIYKLFFLVTRKVRFLAMTMFEQARHCSFGLTITFISLCCDLNASVLTEEHKKHKEVVFSLF